MPKITIHFEDAAAFKQNQNQEFEDSPTTRYSGLTNGLACLHQHGGLCGLYALASVLRLGCGVPQIVAYKQDRGAASSVETLLSRVIHDKASFIGEMANVDYMARLFNSYDLKALPCRCEPAILDPQRLVDTISANGIVLIPYIAGPRGMPVTKCDNPRNIHWCVAFGLEWPSHNLSGPPAKVFTAHWGRCHTYDLEAVIKSNNAIVDNAISDMYKIMEKDPLPLFQAEDTNLSGSLSGYHELGGDKDAQREKLIAKLQAPPVVRLAGQCLCITRT